MSKTPPPFDYDALSGAIDELTSKAIADGADPQFVAARVHARSMGVALQNGLSCTLKHILLVQDQAEADMKRFYDTYDHQFDLKELLNDRIVPKA